MSFNNGDYNNLKITTVITGNHTLDPIEDKVIDCANVSGDTTITVPQASTLPLDAILRTTWVVNNSPYVVTIQLSGSNKFRTNNTSIPLTYTGDKARIGGVYRADGVTGWVAITNIQVGSQARRNSSWAAANFSSSTAIPFDTTDVQILDEIIEHETITNPSRITVKKKGTYVVEYWYDIDSTGGSTYNILTKIMKNGSTEIAGLTTRTGNFGSEDTSASVAGSLVVLDEDDYIELEIDQNSLTGNLVNAVIVVRTWI